MESRTPILLRTYRSKYRLCIFYSKRLTATGLSIVTYKMKMGSIPAEPPSPLNSNIPPNRLVVEHEDEIPQPLPFPTSDPLPTTTKISSNARSSAIQLYYISTHPSSSQPFTSPACGYGGPLSSDSSALMYQTPAPKC